MHSLAKILIFSLFHATISWVIFIKSLQWFLEYFYENKSYKRCNIGVIIDQKVVMPQKMYYKFKQFKIAILFLFMKWPRNDHSQNKNRFLIFCRSICALSFYTLITFIIEFINKRYNVRPWIQVQHPKLVLDWSACT